MMKKLARLARPELLSVAGLACMVTAAFLVHVVAGVVTLGVALLLLEWRLDR